MSPAKQLFTLSNQRSFTDRLRRTLKEPLPARPELPPLSPVHLPSPDQLSLPFPPEAFPGLVIDLDHPPHNTEDFLSRLRSAHPEVVVVGVLDDPSAPPQQAPPHLLSTQEAGGPALMYTLQTAAAAQAQPQNQPEHLLSLEKQLQEYQAIHQASLTLSSDLELSAVLASILKNALVLIPADDAHIFLYDGKKLSFGAALFNGEEQKEPYSNPRPDGITANVARRGKKIVVHDVQNHALFEDVAWEGSILGQPLITGEQVQGVMNIAFESPHFFTPQEQKLLDQFADQAAIAIHNANLYQIAQEEISERRQAEQALRESEKRYRVLFNSSKDANMTIHPPDWKFTSGNQALMDMFLLEDGDQLRELTPADLSPLRQPTGQRSQDLFPKMAQRALQRGSHFFEWTHQRVNGEPFPSTVLLTRVDLEEESFLQATVRDITKRKEAEQALKTSEENLRRLVEGTQALIINVNPQGRITYLNESLARLLGKKTQDLIGQVYVKYIDPRDRERVMSFYRGSLTEENSSSLEFRLLTEEGVRWVRFVNHPIREGEEVVGQSGVALDITKSVKLERKAEERRMYLEGLLSAALDAIVTSDNQGFILEWNTGAENLFGYTREEALGKHIDQLISEGQSERSQEAQELTQHVLSLKTVPPTETIRFRKDGSAVNVVLTAAPIIIAGEVVGGVATYTDITPQKELEKAIKHMATHDSLTGLPNRRLFNDRIVMEISHAQRRDEKVAVVLLDLDRFKEVNDSLGHSIGDKLLQHIGKRLSAILRKSDTVARMGGDEFMIILPEIKDIKESEASLSRILSALRKPFHVEGHQLNISASMGAAFYPDHGVDVDTLVKHADIAMYRSKAGGGSQYQFFSSSGD